jgi:hypothetical protein
MILLTKDTNLATPRPVILLEDSPQVGGSYSDSGEK